MKIIFLMLFFTLVYGCQTRKTDSKIFEETEVIPPSNFEDESKESNADIPKEILVDSAQFRVAKLGTLYGEIVIVDCEKCAPKAMLDVYDNLDSMSYQSLFNFLCTLDSQCEGNAELSQFSDELFFKILKILIRYPDKVVNLVKEYDLMNEYIPDMTHLYPF